jgi:hypothetical protein
VRSGTGDVILVPDPLVYESTDRLQTTVTLLPIDNLPIDCKQKAPRRNRRGAKSKNEFELAGYLAFFTLVASDPKSIQREANVGRWRRFVKPAGRREAVESPHRTLRQLGRVHLKGIHRDEEHRQGDVFDVFALANDFSLSAGVTTQSVTTNPSIAAPPETSGFRGSIDNGIFPSDAAGEVSASFLLSVTNASVVAQDRSGNRLSDLSLADFWHDPAYPDGALYDPRVAHDNDTDRWIICTLYDVSFKKSTLLVAVSDGSNPSLGWHRYRFYSYIDPLNHLSAPAMLKSGEKPSPDTRWADFSTTVVDANDVDFWTTQTYEAATTARWTTWWGRVEVAVPSRRRAVLP